MNRRNFLRIAGTGAIIVAAGAGTFFATRSPKYALEPWNLRHTQYPDPIRRALSYAILAPNPHNRQPWMVKLNGDTDALLTCDLERLLPQTDPFDRQIVIGLGCFLELFALAASHDGMRAQITLFPNGVPGERLDTRPIARLQLVDDAAVIPDALFLQALNRRTNRNPYDLTRSIAAQDLRSIAAAPSSDVIVDTNGDGELRDRLRELTRVALRDEILDPPAFQESVDLMRIGRAEIEANPDGISLRGPLLESLKIVGILSRETLADPESSAFQIGLDMADEQALTAMGFVWINTRGNTRLQQIAAGRAYLRVALRVAELGLAMQPMSQALQEYAAMESHFASVHASLAANDDERVQMLARLGYATAVEPAPRWALSTRIEAG